MRRPGCARQGPAGDSRRQSCMYLLHPQCNRVWEQVLPVRRVNLAVSADRKGAQTETMAEARSPDSRRRDAKEPSGRRLPANDG